MKDFHMIKGQIAVSSLSDQQKGAWMAAIAQFEEAEKRYRLEYQGEIRQIGASRFVLQDVSKVADGGEWRGVIADTMLNHVLLFRRATLENLVMWFQEQEMQQEM